MPLTWRTVASFAELADVESQWDSIVDARALPPDHDRRWQESLWHNFADDYSLQIETCWDTGNLVGIAALISSSERRKGVATRITQPLTALHHLRGSRLVVDDAHAVPLVEKLLSGGSPHAWDLLMTCYREDDPQRQVVEKAATSGGFPYVVHPALPAPYLQLPDEWSELLSSYPKKFRYELRTREKTLRKQGNVELRFLDGIDTYEEGLRCIEQIESESWKSTGGLPITDSLHWGFYKRYAPAACKKGNLRLPILFVADEPVAFDYGVYANGTYFLLQTSYRASWKAHYPGFVLRKMLVEHLCAAGAQEIDLGPGTSIWKSKWTKAVRSYQNYTVFNRNPKGRYQFALTKLASLCRSAANMLRRKGE